METLSRASSQAKATRALGAPQLTLTPQGASLRLAWGNRGTERALPGSHRELVADLGQDPGLPAPSWAHSGHKCILAPSGNSVHTSAPHNPARKRQPAPGRQPTDSNTGLKCPLDPATLSLGFFLSKTRYKTPPPAPVVRVIPAWTYSLLREEQEPLLTTPIWASVSPAQSEKFAPSYSPGRQSLPGAQPTSVSVERPGPALGSSLLVGR